MSLKCILRNPMHSFDVMGHLWMNGWLFRPENRPYTRYIQGSQARLNPNTVKVNGKQAATCLNTEINTMVNKNSNWHKRCSSARAVGMGQMRNNQKEAIISPLLSIIIVLRSMRMHYWIRNNSTVLIYGLQQIISESCSQQMFQTSFVVPTIGII